MSNRVILLWLYLLLSCTVDAQKAASGGFDEVGAKVAQGDRTAIYQAGASGDRRFVGILRQLVRHYASNEKPVLTDAETRNLRNEPITGAARLALAKLGDSAEQRSVFCRVYSNNLDLHLYAMQTELPYIGGWFEINILSDILSDETSFQSSRAKGDVIYPGPIHYAVVELHQLFPNGPRSAGSDQLSGILTDQKDGQEWQGWIERHRKELMRLPPGGIYSKTECPQESEARGAVSADNGEPLDGARVQIEWDVTAGHTTSGIAGLSFDSRTAPDGSFNLFVPAGNYRICAAHEGYLSHCENVRLQSGRDFVWAVSLPKNRDALQQALKFLLDIKVGRVQANQSDIKRAFRMLSSDKSSAQQLVQLLDLHIDTSEGLETKYPAIGALAIIGKPAIPYLVDAISQENDELLLTNAAHALALINRTCVEDVLARLDTEIQNLNTSAEERNRLVTARSYIVNSGLWCEAREDEAKN